jgi:Ca2+-binding RTX toxin-like protein
LEYFGGGIPDNLHSADVDGDGKEEIIGLDARIRIGRNSQGVIDVDLNHSPTTEVLFWGWNGTAMVERTDLWVTGFEPARYGIYHFEFLDFNFDGHLDLVVPRPDSAGNSPMQVFLNDGAGHFKIIADKLLPVRLSGGQASSGEVLDINGDLIMDVLIRTDGHSAAGEDWGPWGAASEALFLGTRKFHTGPKYTDPALKGAAGFNEQYYLNTYADAAKAVSKGKFDSGLEHYLEVGKKKGYFGFAVDTHIFGSNESDTIKAREGEEQLDGGLGKDTLYGRGSADTFVFSTKLGATNVDTIKDFKPGQGDLLALDRDIFKKIGAALEDNEFFAKKGATKAHDRDDRIVYDTKSGKLYYDADGNKKGGADAIHFATLSNKAALDAGDFAIV